MNTRRIVPWLVIVGILAAAGAAAWWFYFSPAAKFKDEYGQLVRCQKEYRPLPTARELHDMLYRNKPLAPPPPPASAPQVYDPRVLGAAERLGRELRALDGTRGLELLRDCFRSHAAKGDRGPNPDDSNRLVAQRIGVQYSLGLPPDRLRQSLAYLNQSDWGDAMLAELLKMFLERLLRDGPAEFQALDEEARQKKESGDDPGALDTYRKALAYSEKWQLPVPQARTLIGMGSTLRKMDRLKEAEAAYLKAKTVLDSAPHPEADDATLSNNLGLLYMDLDRWEDAYAWMSKAAEIDRKRSSGEPAFLALDLINLIAVCGKLGRLEEGARLGDEAMTLCCQGQLENHPFCAAAKVAAAGIQADQGRLAEAEALYRSAIDIYERLDPKPAVVLAQACDNYAQVLEKMGRSAAARAARDKAAACRKAGTPSAPAS